MKPLMMLQCYSLLAVIASIFARLLFDWQSLHGQVVGKGIWMYFVVTFPLTGFSMRCLAGMVSRGRPDVQRRTRGYVLGNSGSKGNIGTLEHRPEKRGCR